MPEPKYNGLKWIFLGLIAAAFLCFVMGGVTLRQEIARLKQKPQAPPVMAHYSPFPRSMPQAPPKTYPQVKPPEPVKEPVKQTAAWQPPPAELLGKWQGGGATTTGFFFITIEITPNPRNPGQLLAYAQTINMAMPIPRLGKRQPGVAELLAQRMPRQFSLVGMPSDDGGGGVAFHVSKAIGALSDCPLTDIRVSSWGTEGISAEWKVPACPGNRASFAARSRRSYTSFGEVAIFRCSSCTASRNFAVEYSYSAISRAFSSHSIFLTLRHERFRGR